ncbi:MAG: hypothetical protein M3297_06700 [Thermoproteota archaeon]|nr:hypothetical protein [Thermoproteota archaeon]
MKTEQNNKSKSSSLLYLSSLTTRVGIVYFGVTIGLALQIGAANWDIIWHGVTDVESFFTPPHTVLYSGVALTIGSVFLGIILYIRQMATIVRGEKVSEQQQQKVNPNELTTTKSLSSTLSGGGQGLPSSFQLLNSPNYLMESLSRMPYPIKLVAIGTIIEIFAGGFDSWWHYTFGFDGLLSPPHLMLTTGMLTSVYGALIGIYILLEGNRHVNNSKSTLLKVSFTVTYAVAWIVSVNTIFMFSLPYSKGQYFDFNPDPLAALLIASIAIPFVSGMIFYSATKTLRDVHFRFTFITLAFMIIHSTATIISNPHFVILYPLYLLNIIPALIADILISLRRNQNNKKENSSVINRRKSRHTQIPLEKKRARMLDLLRNQTLVAVFGSAIVPAFFITLFFPWSVNVYKEFFGIDMNTFESIAIFDRLLWPFIVLFVIPVSVLMSIIGSYIMSAVLDKPLQQDVHI